MHNVEIPSDGYLMTFLFIIVVFKVLIKLFGYTFEPYSQVMMDLTIGALGGSIYVSVIRNNMDINLFFGTLKKDGEKIYSGRWDEAETIRLSWETDDVLYVNYTRCDIN